MANRNAVVSTVFRLEPPVDRRVADTLRSADGLSIEIEDGRRLRLDPADPRSVAFAEVLNGLREQGRPAYLEFDPDTSAVTRVRIPYVSPVLALRTVDRGVFDVVLARSHARHLLRERSEDFGSMREQLDEAVRSGRPLIVVDDDEHEIIEVLPVPADWEEGGPPVPERPPRFPGPWRRWLPDIRELLRRFWLWHRWPWWWWFRCIPRGHAQQIFDAMQATSCNPVMVPPPCIPFMYPDDGCWGRASEMCRLMQLQGLHPRKVWIQGTLNVATRNNTTCSVGWGWHVAPTLCVRGPRFLQRERLVIDPSLFTTPVTEAQWKGVQGDPLATLTDTDASVFHLFYPPEATDPTYALTNSVLATYRLELQLRSANQGPPPYANCP